MAKQNVTFVERHLEKIVLGVTGAVLLATAIFYLIMAPHQVEVRGDNIGPQQLYATVREQADTALQQMKRAQMDTGGEPGGPSIVVPDVVVQRSPYEAESLPKEFSIPFGPLNPEVPEIKGAQRGKIQLADILPPSPVVVTTGRAYAKLARPTVMPDNLLQRPAAEPLPAVTQDWNWVTVFAAVHRKDQRARFDEAQYALERQHLIVAGVEAQRQERLPDGEWGPAQIVTGYAETVIPVRRTAELIRQDDGSTAVSDLAGIDQYKKNLEKQETQATLLRPDIQKFLDPPLAWEVPAELPGLSIKWEDYEVIVPAAPATRRLRPLEAQPGQPDTSRQTPLQILRLADQAITEKNYLEAERLLQSIETSTAANSRQKEDARNKLRGIQSEIDQAKLQAAQKELRAAASVDLGPDVEPLWLTDLTVTPGTIYRYRLRLLVFNAYVGLAPELEREEDAGKVVIEGNWSEWSEPVEVRPVSYLFFTTARGDTGRIEMRDWFNGQWYIGTRPEIQVGDPIAFTEARHDFTYDAAVIVGLNPQITYQERSAAAMMLIKADGEVEERITSVDIQRRKDLLNEIRDAQKQLDEWTKHNTQPPTVERRPAVQPTGRPPARGFDLENELGR